MEQDLNNLTPSPNNPVVNKLHSERIEHEREVKELKDRLISVGNELYAIRKRFCRYLIMNHYDEYAAFYKEYLDKKESTAQKLLALKRNKRSLLAKLRSGKIDNATYRKCIKQYASQYSEVVCSLQGFVSKEINLIFGENGDLFEYLPEPLIIKFLQDNINQL